MELENLAEWNPWWESKDVIREFEGVPRPNYSSLLDSVDIKEITIITGVRRSGKSTLMYQIVGHLLRNGVKPEQILFVNLEDKKLAKDTLDDIYRCYRQNMNLDGKAYIFLDEIHRKEGWESWIRKKYDLKTNDKFVISGSCSYLLKKEYSTLLTGRNLTFEVFPLGFDEFLLFKGIEASKENLRKGIVLEKTKLSILRGIKEYLECGGFPEAVLKQEPYKMKILKQYFDDILFKDIVDRYELNIRKAEELALFLMTNFTGLVSLRNIRNSLKLSYDTTKDYISYYKDAFLFFRLDRFSFSLKEQKSSAAKIYCIDNGLRNAVSFKFSRDEGKLAENLVFIELKRRNSEVYYWESPKHKEVDFVVKGADNALKAINVTYTDEIDKRETDGLLQFKENFRKTSEMIVLTRDLEKEVHGIRFIPLWKWLLE